MFEKAFLSEMTLRVAGDIVVLPIVDLPPKRHCNRAVPVHIVILEMATDG